MKVLGLNFGRKNGNCIQFLQSAIDEAATHGAETEIIQMMPKKIGHCLGCGSCSRALESGQPIRCVIKDDYEAVSDAVLAADAIIVAAPVYVLAPTGQLKNFLDRFGPAHDMAYMLFENQLRLDRGGDPLPDDCFKRHYVSYISVGGATTEHWVSMGLMGLQLFGMSLNMKVVDQVNVTGAYIPSQKERFLPRCAALGARTAEAVGRRYSELNWEAEPGACPICHTNLLMLDGSTRLCCPVCGIYGTARIEGDRLFVDFSEEERRRSRLNLAGVIEHQAEIGRRDRYPDYDDYVEKFSKMAGEK